MAKKNQKTKTNQSSQFQLISVKPLTENQRLSFYQYNQEKNLFLMGSAGTGKTFIAMYLALSSVLNENSPYKKIYIIRSMVPTRDIGFLPGSLREKGRIYESPYEKICAELMERGDAYEILKTKNVIDFTSTSFIRGVTFANCIIIVDEAQNLNSHEINSIMTRVGNNCRMIICGDIKQTDLMYKEMQGSSWNTRFEKSGFYELYQILSSMKEFSIIEFGREDIVRSSFVKNYIITREKLEERGIIKSLYAFN